MSTKSKKASAAAPAKKQAPKPVESDNDDQLEDIEDPDLQDEHEEEAEAPDDEEEEAEWGAPPKKKTKAKLKIVAMEDDESEAPVSKLAQIRKQVKRKTTEAAVDWTEEKEPESVPKKAAVEAASTAMVVRVPDKLIPVRTVVAVPPQNLVQSLIMDEPKAEDKRSYLERFRDDTNALLPLVNKGLARTKHPDQAVLLWSLAGKKKIHCLELDKPEKVLVTRKEQKKKVDGKLVGTGVFYVNFRTKFEQRFVDDDKDDNGLMGFQQVSCFATTRYMKHGPTEELGVDGDKGKVIKGITKTPGTEQYQCLLSNKPYNGCLSDDNDNNPLVSYEHQVWNEITDVILIKLVAMPGALTEVKAAAAKMAKANGKKVPPVENHKAWVSMIKAYGLFKGKVETDEEDKTATTLGTSTSVYRAPKNYWDGGREIGKEDLSDYVPPSDMFKKNSINTVNGNMQIHNNIPVYRCRRANEVVPGKKYSSPFILIPAHEAVLDSQKDILAVRYSRNVYEWKLDKMGMTNKPQAYIWLSTKKQIKRLDLDDVEACDPRYAVPFAGYYRGCSGAWIGGAPPEGEEEEEEEEEGVDNSETLEKAGLEGLDASDFE